MKKLIATGLCSLALGFLPLSTSANLIWTEDFTYPDGALTNVSSLWTTHSGTANPILISGNMVAGMSAGGGSREDSNRLLDTTYSTGLLFAGFDLTLSITPVGSAYFLHFKDATTSGFRARVFLSEPTATGFRLGLENDGGDNAAALPVTSDLEVGSTYRVILGYDTAAGTSRLWVNNLSESSPTLEDTTAASPLTITALALRQGGSATATYTGLDIDNLIVATDFVSVVPEPSTYALGLLGLATLFFLRRRK